METSLISFIRIGDRNRFPTLTFSANANSSNAIKEKPIKAKYRRKLRKSHKFTAAEYQKEVSCERIINLAKPMEVSIEIIYFPPIWK